MTERTPDRGDWGFERMIGRPKGPLIAPVDLAASDVIALPGHHATTSRAQSEAGSAHARDFDGRRGPDIRVWTVRDKGQLLAIGALRRLDAGHGEVKSMHVAEAARQRGVGSLLVARRIAVARAGGLKRLSLDP